MSNEVISYDKKGFIINGKREFLIGGEFHYFRVPAELWEDRLQKMKRSGANLISVYIPWSMHEPEEGKERWSGDYDVNRFLALCEKYSLYVLIKPGPYVCAELDFGGHPDWLIGKIAKKEIKLRMLEDGYLKYCQRWYKTVSEKINSHLITNGGNIIAIQIENEYDHLIEYGEETITQEDAINYFLFLKKAMEDVGIDIPKFANEAAFLRGRDIIDTRTYYPNIPGLWMWEFDLFESKIIESKKSQSTCPVMILELQAGWFAQVGAPIYEPQLDVVEGVSKSVLIQGASIMNYYMMVGGTTFPFIGARGDTVFSGGLGNITSYDFGGSPIGETGELHKDKYYWIKGFTRFSKEFSNLILDSDERSFVKLMAGGEDIALVGSNGAELDCALDISNENFITYEKGNTEGSFFFIRNLEDDQKNLTVKVSKELLGREYVFKTLVKGKETRLLPIAFKVPGTDILINYSTSEVLLSKAYEKGTAFVMYGKNGTAGEISLNAALEDVTVIKGNVEIINTVGGILLKYSHSDINIIKVNSVYLFLMEEGLIGRIEELSTGLLFSNAYYVGNICDTTGGLELQMQIKENTENIIRVFPMVENSNFKHALIDGNRVAFKYDKVINMYIASFKTGSFENKPQLIWTSDWMYSSDSKEIDENYDISGWHKLEKPISLEEAGFIEHGYYWYKTSFELEAEPGMIFMDYVHNDTDRMFIYINGNLVYKSHNKKINHKDITNALRKGTNNIAILYANEFHNKSHPHEGDLVKFSGIMNPFVLYGNYKDGSKCSMEITSFYLQKGLTGINEGYNTCGYNDSSWNTAPDVRKFVTGSELGHIVWFRRKFRYDINESFSAPLSFSTQEADQRLTIYINGKAVARYDILGPQQEFHIPETFLNPGEENVVSIILECPAFYDELQGGYRRGYMYNPELKHSFLTKTVTMKIQ